MSFTPFSLVALKTELTTDPLGLGYAPLVAAREDNLLSDLINKKDNRFSVPSEPISNSNFVALYDGDLKNFTAAESSQLLQIITPGEVNIGNSNIQGSITGILANHPDTLARITSIFNRVGSRTESLFGTSAQGGKGFISTNDISEALN